MTYSVRKGSLIRGEEFWLVERKKAEPQYAWMYFENRTHFKTQEEADKAAKDALGNDNYGVFPNSNGRK